MFNFNHLYYFYITAKHRGFTSASKHLRISQPSLSSQLKVLEGMLNVKLFQKAGRKNELTEAGSLVYGFCRQIFELSEQLSESLTTRKASAMRRIHIGVSDEVDRQFVVEVVSLFLKKHGVSQRPSVVLTSGNRERLFTSLQFRELDVVVSEMAATDRELHNLCRAEVPVALVCSSKQEKSLGLKKKASMTDILEIVGKLDAQWVMPSTRFKLRAEIDHFFETHNLKGKIVFESDVMASLVRSVGDDIGASFLPLLYVAREIREKNIKIIGPRNGFWKYRVWLVSSGQNQNDILIRTLAESFDQICKIAMH